MQISGIFLRDFAHNGVHCLGLIILMIPVSLKFGE